MKPKLKIGIVGYGKMGALRHHICNSISGYNVVALTDPYVKNIKTDQVITVYQDWPALLANPDIDAIIISTVNALNAPITIAALESGKHVFCEKPPALNTSELSAVIEAEQKSGNVLMYGFNHRHHGATIKMKEIIEGGELGEVLWMRGRYGKSVDADFLSTWRCDPKLAGGGILIDQGIHMLDLFLYLGGSFDDIKAFVSSLYWDVDGIEDNVFAILQNTKNGRVASLHSTMTQWRHLFSLEIFMESGSMVLNGLKTSSNTYGQEKLVISKNRTSAPAASWEDEEEYVFEIDVSWEKEMQVFYEAISSGSKVKNGNSSDAYAVMSLIDKIYESKTYQAQNRYLNLDRLSDERTQDCAPHER